MGHGQPVDGLARVFQFGARGFQKLQPGRSGVEQVTDLDPGAGGMRGRTGRAFPPALDGDGPGGVTARIVRDVPFSAVNTT